MTVNANAGSLGRNGNVNTKRPIKSQEGPGAGALMAVAVVVIGLAILFANLYLTSHGITEPYQVAELVNLEWLYKMVPSMFFS